MGRTKLKIQKIVSPKKLQATYSKRKKGLLKMAEVLSVLCDVDIGVIMFSPSGMLTHSCRDGINEVLARFVNTPQSERANSRAETTEFVRNLMQKLSIEPRLETPRAAGADLRQEVEELRIQLRNAKTQRDISAARSMIDLDSLQDLKSCVQVRTELLTGMENVEKQLAKARSGAF